MKPIVMFVPFYGTVPSYISAFFHTVALQNDFMDVYFISDKLFLSKLKEYNIPQNVLFIELKWDELCNLINEKTKLRSPFFPYKLCDYKPAYGHIFDSYTKGYQYWGYMDIDVLVGDIKGFLERSHYQQYDRIGVYGHFTIYKNNEKFRFFYREEASNVPYFSTLKHACQTTYPCHVDENGTNIIYTKKYGDRRFLQKNFALNTSFECKGCHTYEGKDLPQILTWENGHTYSYTLRNGQIEQQEGMYIHFIKEKNLKSSNNLSDSFIITPNELIPFYKDEIWKYLNSVGKVDTIEERQSQLARFRKRIRNSRRNKFIREYKTVGFVMTISVVIRRLHAIPDLLKHKLF